MMEQRKTILAMANIIMKMVNYCRKITIKMERDMDKDGQLKWQHYKQGKKYGKVTMETVKYYKNGQLKWQHKYKQTR